MNLLRKQLYLTTHCKKKTLNKYSISATVWKEAYKNSSSQCPHSLFVINTGTSYIYVRLKVNVNKIHITNY